MSDQTNGGAGAGDTEGRPPLRDRAARVDLSRTWEIELFISGATVFALLQAPRIVDRWYTHAAPHLAGGSDMLVFFAYYYAKLILYTLIATFFFHLLARAYWVALVGLHSVFPLGVRWSELQYGPAFTDEFRRRLPPLEQSIRRVDDLSSLLFSGGAVVLLMFVGSVILIAPMALVAAVVSRLVPGLGDPMIVLMVLVFVVAMVPVIARSLDLRAGKRAPGAPPAKGLRRAAVLSYYMGAAPVVGPLSLVLTSNLGRRSAAFATVGVLVLIIGTFLLRDVLLPRGGLRLDSHVYLSDAPALQELRPVYYADERSPDGVYETLPFVQSAVITEPYLRLFVPITPDRHNPLIAERCPELAERAGGLRLVTARSTAGDAPDAQPFIDCVAGFQPISLDGQRLDGLPWRLATDPMSGVRGLMALIPVTELIRGEHVLRIEGLPRPAPREGSRRERPPRPPHIIRFWT